MGNSDSFPLGILGGKRWSVKSTAYTNTRRAHAPCYAYSRKLHRTGDAGDWFLSVFSPYPLQQTG